MIPETVKASHDWRIRLARDYRWEGDKATSAYWLASAVTARQAYMKTLHYRATGELIERPGKPLGFIPPTPQKKEAA